MRQFVAAVLVSLTALAAPMGVEAAGTPPPSLVLAAESGSPDAMFDMGEFYFRNPATKDLEKARDWYLKAANAGHPKGQALAGYFLVNGVGGPADLAGGVAWYQKAVEQGQHMAEYNLGLMYEKGRGVPKDFARAVELFKEAAKDPRYNLPQYRIGRIHAAGVLGKPDLNAAADWYGQAATRGHAGARYELARILEAGASSVQELRVARDMYARAAEAGVAAAKEGMARIDTALMLTTPTPDAARDAAKAKAAANAEAASKAESAAKSKAARPSAEALNVAFPYGGGVVEYKGRVLIGSSYPEADNDEFFKWMKWAIDRTEELPEELRAYPRLIKEIRYNPPSKQRARNDAYTNIVGVYTVGRNDRFPAPIIIYQDVKWGAPIYFAYSLAGNGLRAYNHKRRLEIAARLGRHARGTKKLPPNELRALSKEHRQLVAALKKTDQESMEIYECRAMKYEYELMKAWEEDPRRKDARARELSNRRCWDR